MKREPDEIPWKQCVISRAFSYSGDLSQDVVSNRSTGYGARLLDASRRLWPSAVAFTRTKLSESRALQSDAKSLTTEIWEEALFSVLRTMEKLGRARISDLDAYLFAIFTNRLNRYLA